MCVCVGGGGEGEGGSRVPTSNTRVGRVGSSAENGSVMHFSQSINQLYLNTASRYFSKQLTASVSQ